MSEERRRELFKRLAKGAVHAAPGIRTMSAPLEVVAQGQSTSHKNDHGGPWSGSSAGGSGLGGPPGGSRFDPEVRSRQLQILREQRFESIDVAESEAPQELEGLFTMVHTRSIPPHWDSAGDLKQATYTNEQGIQGLS